MASPSLSTSATLNKSDSTTSNVNNTEPNSIRKSSNASSSMGGSMDSETARLLNSLGSVGSSLADVGTGIDGNGAASAAAAGGKEGDKTAKEASDTTAATITATDDDGEAQFQVPATVPQHHHLKFASSADDPNLHSSLPKLSLPTEENGSLSSSKGSSRISERRLPSKKRKMSYESYDAAVASGDSAADRRRKMSCESFGSAIMNDMSFLSRRRKMSYESYDSAMGDSYLGLATLDSGIVPKLPDVLSVATKGSGTSADNLPLPAVSALDHLDALGDDGAELPTTATVVKIRPPDEGSASKQYAAAAAAAEPRGPDDQSDGDATFTSSGHRILMEAIMMTSGEDMGRRKRFESWGGMSDLSVHMGGTDTAAAIAASALHHTGIFDDVTAAANFGGGSVASSVTDDHPKPPAETATDGRDRTASMSDGTFPVPASLDGVEISSDLQKFVAAAVASVGDTLAELAGNIESVTAAVHLDNKPSAAAAKDDDTRQGSEVSSIATQLMLGTSLDDLPKIPFGDSSTQPSNPDKSVNAGISVDYDAVAAAVDAAHAATGDLDLSAIEGAITIHGQMSSTASSISSGAGKAKWMRKLPTHGKKASTHAQLLKNVPKSLLSEKEQEELHERARKAAGYVPPSQSGEPSTPNNRALPPLKKRKRMTPEPAVAKSSAHETPKISNTSSRVADQLPSVVVSAAAKTSGAKSGNKEKSTQKWDSMYDCLLQFVLDRKEEETAGASEEEIADWIWDGNVPTTYKTKDGKALGRWINNQRSAKSKGTLKEEREIRLVNAGLKWSVLASNSWNEMLDELGIYIAEYTKDGKKWDGNVPTNYRIKARANGKKMSEEDKNLGRWVNRQRSLYQAGRLRKDRQLALEKIGLKWSMLATTSWDAMYETLLEYVKDKETKGVKWDGNVPANYRTDDHPPRALGRWINRQRSTHVKKKLKQEYVDKLSNLGLKWSVHERPRIGDPEVPNPDSSTSGVVAHTASVPATIAVPAKQSDKTQDGLATQPTVPAAQPKAPAAQPNVPAAQPKAPVSQQTVPAAQQKVPLPVRVTSVRFDDEKEESKGNNQVSKPQPKTDNSAVDEKKKTNDNNQQVDSKKVASPQTTGQRKTNCDSAASGPTSQTQSAPPSKPSVVTAKS
ncbi:Helicase associated domain [Seminavis robusta]|uniref:Helicase associated domain n=1 Tax=Seminavis robusta TaxID=568900 RepID=A0A9N8DR64_9STRA|nr:Helicase associated domain [Seminavis robusta]|eukprot:Sro229_g093100.1 Helicase associated domain (1136) ;mRNA; r:59656-63476